MLPIHAPLARRSVESRSLSALPGAPVVPMADAPPAAGTRRALATALLSLADRVSPEPVERSRWQSG
jgi:hypothetical protein